MHIILLILSFLVPASALEPPSVEPPILGKGLNKTDAAVIIGNESYQKFPQVVFAAKDGELMAEYFRKSLRLYKSRIFSLTNANRKKMESSIKKASKKVRNGTLWVFFSGHGYVQESGERALLPADIKDEELNEKSISFNDIIAIARKNKRGKNIIIIADANFGNTGRDGLSIFGRTKVPAASPLPNSNPTEVIWIPSEDHSSSPNLPISQHGLFTYLVSGSLRGWADGEISGQEDGTLTLHEAQSYVRHKMVSMGVPIKPSIHQHADAQKIEFTTPRIEKGPDVQALKELSVDLRARRFEEAADFLKARATSNWQISMYKAQKGGSDGEKALRDFLDEYEYATINMRWAVYVPEVEQARQLLKSYELKGNIADFKVEDCQDRSQMKSKAMIGALSDAQIACMESQIRLNRTQTERSKISLVLITNAQMKKDLKSYEKLVRRHLEQYDRSDPTLCLAFAIFLYKKGESKYEESLKWADYANENRMQWEGGSDFVQKSNTLFKLRSELATNLWVLAEDAFRKEKTPENEDNVQNNQGKAKEYAREWLDYCRAANLPEQARRAFDMCVSAAGNVDLCRE
ncbi:MAG: caspase family protein [Myxococcota bacterium]|nr:caspase family protein [Myxococcota bacterium]